MKKTLCVFLITALIYGCTTEKRKADTSNSSIKISIHRFDKDFWQQNSQNLQQSMNELYQKYPAILPIYTKRALNLGDWNDKETIDILQQYFFPDSTIQKLYGDCLNQYENISDIEKKLTEAFQRAQYFFPKEKIPEIYFHVSAGANPEALIDPKFISISIDNYLGADYPLYQNAVYGYLRYNMRREKVAPDIITIWIAQHFPSNPISNQFIEKMLYRGKIIYTLSVLMPKEKEYLLLGYSPQQFEWCKKRESELWMYMIEKKHLFSTDNMLVVKYLNDAPFTSFFSQESPGRIGVFIGWRIIESYMHNNPDITLYQLMQNVNYKAILEQSKYQP